MSEKRYWRVILAAVTALLLLSSCGTKGEQNENNAGDMVTDIISGETSSISEKNAEENTADTSVTEAAVLSENKIVNGVIMPPDEDFLRSIFTDPDDIIAFALDSNGKYSVCDIDLLLYHDEDRMMHEYAKELISEEYYEENKEYFEDEVSSYEEYRAMAEELYGDELKKYLEYEPEKTEPLAYFILELYIDEDETAAYSGEQVFIRSVNRLVERINEDPEIAERLNDCFENGRGFYAAAEVDYSGGDVIEIDSAILENLFTGSVDESAFDLVERISADGKDGITLAGTFVPADTEKLFLTDLSMSSADAQTKETVPEDCLKVSCYDMDELPDKRYDLKYIAENLPELRELYIFHAGVIGTEYIGEMKNLESLGYNAYVMAEDGYYEPASDTPFTELPKLKDLWLYGSHADYSFLNDMPALENVFVNLRYYSQPYDSLFDCPVVTGIEIDIGEAFSRVEKLKNLQHLQHLHLDAMSSGDDMPLNLSVLGEFKELTCLHIRCRGYEPQNISVIGELSKLENLELSYISDVEDWSFMQKLTSLKRIYFFEVWNLFDEVQKMTWLDEDNIIY